MFGVSTVFLFLAIGLVSGQTISITPSPSMGPKPSSANSTAPKPTSPIHSSSSHSLSPVASSSVSASIAPNKTASASPSPSASPTPKPTTKPTTKPTSKPPQPDGDYSVNKDGKYCLLAILDATFMIPYEEQIGVNKTKKPMKATVHMPFNSSLFDTTDSTCGPTPVLKIIWHFYDFTMKFKSSLKGVNDTKWEVTSMELMVTTKNNKLFKNATENTIKISTTNLTELSGLKAGIKGYYMCEANRTYPFNKGQLFLKYVKLQPFGVNNKTELFGKEYNCESPTPSPAPKKDDSNIVPIAVGCALAGLVLIVLIAYIIGRRKSQRGYEKV